MDSNLICHPTPTKKMKYLFLYYVQLLMTGQVGWWTRTPSANFLQPNNEMLIFGLCSTSDDQLGWSMDSNHMCHLSPGIKWNAYFWITFNFWWSAVMVDGVKPHAPSLSNRKNEMLILVLCSTSDDHLGWSMDSNPIHHPSPGIKWNVHFCIMFNFWWSAGLVNGLEPRRPPFSSEKMKCSFLDYVQLLMNGRAGRWNQTPSATCLQPKNEMLIFGLCSTSDDWWGWLMDLIPIHHPSPAKKWNAHFWIMFNFWWSAKLVNGLEPICHPSPG